VALFDKNHAVAEKPRDVTANQGCKVLRPASALGLEAQKLVSASALASMATASASPSRHYGLGLVSSGLVVSFIVMY